MKEISLEDIRKIIEQQDMNAFAKEWREFTDTFYGPNAYTVKLHVTGEYNDEGYSSNLEDVTVYDRQGKKIKPDPTLPIYKQELDKHYSEQLAGFKAKFPVLDESAWEKMAKAELKEATAEIIDDVLRENLWEMDYPDNDTDVSSDYDEKHTILVGETECKIPKFYVEEYYRR
jgi:hypothetical protein